MDKISLDDAARLAGVSYGAIKMRLRRARIFLGRDPADARRRVAPIPLLVERGVISRAAYQQWLRDQVERALTPETNSLAVRSSELPARLPQANPGTDDSGFNLTPSRPTARRSAQPLLPFARTGPAHAAIAGVPLRFQQYCEMWNGILGACKNGAWKKSEDYILNGITIRSREDYLDATLPQFKVSKTEFYRKQRLLTKIEQDPAVPGGEVWSEFFKAILPKPRPGRASAAFFAQPENDWMMGELLKLYLNQARLSVPAARRLLLDEIHRRQRAHGLGHLYDEPSEGQCRTALEKITVPELTLAREGEKAYNDKCAPYISRDYSSLHSNDLWVTDQRLVNVRMRGPGEKLGRLWLVNFLDVASFKWLGFSFAPVLGSEVVMMAAANALANAGAPRAVHIDCGKEFANSSFFSPANQGFKISGDSLYGEALGLWDRLGVRVVKAIGRNPQTKTIERWHHVIDDFDKLFPGWCGSNTGERPEKLQAEEAQHRAWLDGRAGGSPLITIDQYILAFAAWAETEWNARHHGRGRILRGMTPNEAYNTRQPLDGFRALADSEVEYQTAERRRLKVARGGQVNLQFYGEKLEYVAPELFHHIGEEVEVIRSRSSLSQITVIYPVPGGTRSCVAASKPQFHWLSENSEDRELLKAAIRCKRATRNAVKRGVTASHLALAAANPVELLAESNAPGHAYRQALLSPLGAGGQAGPNGRNEISGAEFASRRRGRVRAADAAPTTEDLVAKILRLGGEA